MRRSCTFVVLATWFGCTASDGPVLTQANPPRAGIGQNVELTGERFCGMRADCIDVPAKVDIGIASPIVQARIVSYAATTATIEIPVIANPGSTEIVLTVDGRSSNALPFEVLVP